MPNRTFGEMENNWYETNQPDDDPSIQLLQDAQERVPRRERNYSDANAPDINREVTTLCEGFLSRISDAYQNAQMLNRQLQIEKSDASIMQCVEIADQIPLNLLWALRNKIGGDDQYGVQTVDATLSAPTQTRLLAADFLIGHENFVQARRLLNQAERLSPLIGEGERFQKLDQRLNEVLKPVSWPDPRSKSYIEIEGRYYRNTITCKEVLPLFDKNFASLDNNDDGFIDSAEIDDFKHSHYANLDDLELSALLQEMRPSFMGLSDDEIGSENSGITMKDMEIFDAQQMAMNANLTILKNYSRGAEAIRESFRPGQPVFLHDLVELAKAGRLTADERHGVQQIVCDFDKISAMGQLAKSPMERRVRELKQQLYVPVQATEFFSGLTYR